MCGIFGIIGNSKKYKSELRILSKHATQRGRDSSGLIVFNGSYSIERAEFNLEKLIRKIGYKNNNITIGHSRLVTNGLNDNQPYVRNNIYVFHNGIIVNADQLFKNEKLKRYNEIDTEIIAALIEKYYNKVKIEELHKIILSKCNGIVSAAIALPKIGKLILMSNNGSLYTATKNNIFYFSSESYPLQNIGCKNIQKLIDCSMVLNIPKSNNNLIPINEHKLKRRDLITKVMNSSFNESLLENSKPDLIRCSKCLLPHTMPFISFDDKGICNYCKNYKIRNKPKPKSELFKLMEPYRKVSSDDCIIPFSGGRDSCYGLHLAVNELNMKPITYTYDWGMITPLGRRNISTMCAKLGIENIIIAKHNAIKGF